MTKPRWIFFIAKQVEMVWLFLLPMPSLKAICKAHGDSSWRRRVDKRAAIILYFTEKAQCCTGALPLWSKSLQKAVDFQQGRQLTQGHTPVFQPIYWPFLCRCQNQVLFYMVSFLIVYPFLAHSPKSMKPSF